MSITINGEPISEVSSLKNLGERFSSEALCDEEIKIRLELARERTGKLDPLWRSRAISPSLKAYLIQTLVLHIVTYDAEASILTKDFRCNIEAFEMQCNWRSMKISHRDHVMNNTVLYRVDQKMKLLPMVKSRKLKYFGHISCHTSLEKDIMLSTMPGLRR